MAKSPINLLQELSVKQGYFPTYDYMGIKADGIYNRFVYRVDCKNLNAKGIGNNKKEAKQKAAENMLLLLAQNEISVPPVAIKNIQIPTPTKICEPTSPSRIETPSSPNHINYVGLLQEFCVQQQMSANDILYKLVDESGQPHMKNFTIEVSVGSLRERGTAQCKKIAKQEAAKNLLQLLYPDMNMEKNIKPNSTQFNKEVLEDTMRKLGIEISDCVISKPTLPVKEMSKKAQALFMKSITDKVHKVTREDFLLNDLHNSFEETYSNKISYSVRKKMQTVRNAYTHNTDIIQEVMLDIEKALEIKIEKGNLPSLKKENCMVSLRLLSHPIITQCGIGETKRKAEIQAMYNVIVTISTLLNIS